MLNSLEVRTPFIDRNVWEFALRINTKDNYFYRDNQYQGKRLIKSLMQNYGDEFLYRKKRGFSMPLNVWFKNKKSYAYELKNSLLESNSYISDLFDRKGIEEIVNGNHMGSIWLLIVLEEWLNQDARKIN